MMTYLKGMLFILSLLVVGFLTNIPMILMYQYHNDWFLLGYFITTSPLIYVSGLVFEGREG